MLSGVVAKLIVGKDSALRYVGSHLIFSGVSRTHAARSQVDHDVTCRLCTADQHVTLCRCIDRIRPITDRSGHKSAFAGVADTGSTRKPHGHVASLGQLEQALER